ncbi:peptidylarginine deiminase s [Fusarium subglutinans]|uniref:Peptidylarginine deiminase s n=1 Tax=Gibberella subglutinans TaxID=42677 RepID=A0A8H5V409_GIBSU|nr:peptidylarginine deiminase s [Fusarium subglutinans]KAF5608478.1 peptidylarginine deiminase s [Fusarium subglutinans]
MFTTFRRSIKSRIKSFMDPGQTQRISGRYRMPPEWQKHSQTLTAWPSPASIVEENSLRQARAEVSALSNAISRFEPVTMFARPEDVHEASETVSDNVTVRPLAVSELWIRDTGPVFVHGTQNGCSTGLKLNFNYWGAKIPSTGDEAVAANIQIPEASVIDHKDEKDASVPQGNAIPIIDAGFTAEGAAIEVDGDGALLATESSIINENRNPGRSKEELEGLFQKYFGIFKVIWLAGVKGYDITDFHIDAFARFIKPGKVLLSRPSERADPRVIQAYKEAKETLRNGTDHQGRQLEIFEVEEPHPSDLPGENWDHFDVTVASYANYYLPNGGLIMPRFGIGKLDDDAYALFRQHFPDREIVQVDLSILPKLGGGIHCATQQVPAEDWMQRRTRRGELKF